MENRDQQARSSYLLRWLLTFLYLTGERLIIYIMEYKEYQEEYNPSTTKKVSFNLGRFEIKKGGSERSELLEKFLTRLNNARVGTKYKPLTLIGLNRLIRHIPTSQLYPFYKDCERAKNFSAYFFWSIRAQGEVEKK